MAEMNALVEKFETFFGMLWSTAGVDPRSSGLWFDGWAAPLPRSSRPVAPAPARLRMGEFGPQ
jgi:hypothetical protein